MIALLPVSRYRVRYQVASGRPYSFFERFILEAVVDGCSSLDALETIFRVHRRALIEGIVTLVQAGWIALDRNTHKLVSTRAGTRAVRHPDALPPNVVVSEQLDYVVGERVQGQVCRSAEITFSPRAALRAHFDRSAVLRPRDVPHPLDPGLLAPLLRKDDLEWIRACGPVDIVRDGADFAVVDVNTASGVITGIPSKWLPLLRDVLLDEARSKERQLVQAGVDYSTDTAMLKFVRRDLTDEESAEPSPDEFLLEDTPDRLIVGDEHTGLVESWLENARSYITIVSESLEVPTIRHLLEPFRAAMARGVIVDVLWGRVGDDPKSHEDALDLLKKLEIESYATLGRGRLTVGRSPTHSAARILLGDVGDSFEAILGGYDWLAATPSGEHRAVSLLFRELEPVLQLARVVIGLADSDERLSSGLGPTRLRRAADDLSRLGAEAFARRMLELERGATDGTVTVSSPVAQESGQGMRARLVIGRQHHAILPLLSGQARRRFVVTSTQWGALSRTTFKPLLKALEGGCPRVELQYGTDVEPGPEHDELRSQFEKLGGVLRAVPNLDARLVVVDEDTVVVTSFDWLSPTFNRQLAIASDVGFVLRSKDFGTRVLERIGIRASDGSASLAATYIVGFRIKDVRSINAIEWRIPADHAAGWHVLVGDNGSGKTSILRALAVAMIGVENAQALRQNWKTWIRGDNDKASIELTFQRVPASSPRLPMPPPDAIRIDLQRVLGGATIAAEPVKQDAVLSIGYGPFRRIGGGDAEYQKQVAAIPALARHITLFDERVALAESLTWLQDLQFKALEGDSEAALLLDRVTKLVNDSDLLPAGVVLAQITSDAIRFRDDNKYEYGIEELSDGYRTVLSLTFDIVRHLAAAVGVASVFDQEQQYVVAAPAIVLIDEADAHLHPSWQRTVGQWFRTHFPRVQFIVSTHSPLICQAAEGGSVFRLPDPNDESDVGTMMGGSALSRLIYGNILEAYSSGAFGSEVTRSESALVLLDRLSELNRKELDVGLSAEEQLEQEKLRGTLPLMATAVDAQGRK